MQNVKINVVRFNNDVIATSGGTIVLANLGNGIAGDGTISYNGTVIYKSDYSGSEVADEFVSKALGSSVKAPISGFELYISEEEHSLLMSAIHNDYAPALGGRKEDIASSVYNGTYNWNGTKFVKQTN